MVDTVIVENEAVPAAAISWPAVLAGTAVASAFSLMMLALGSGLGFSRFSPWSIHTVNTLRGATFAGIFLAVTAVIASALGGYITGRLRRLWSSVHSDEVVFPGYRTRAGDLGGCHGGDGRSPGLSGH